MLLKYLLVKLLFLIRLRTSAGGIIYYMNDTDHDRLPKVFDLAPFESCLRNPGDTYCLVDLELYSDKPNNELTLVQDYSNLYTTHFNYSLIQRGICLKKQCHKFFENLPLEETQDPKSILERCANETIWNEYGLQSRIQTFSCDKYDEKLEKDIYDWMYLILVLAILGLNVLGTFYDRYNQTPEGNHNTGFKKYLMCFSISQNWKSLLSPVTEDPRLRKLQALHGIRSLLILYFIYGHTFFIYNSFVENVHYLEERYDNQLWRWSFNSLVTVQLLFTISGFLLVYKLLIEAETRPITWKTVPQVILMRFWRLFPANAVIVLFWATWLRHLGSGPLWTSYVIGRLSGHCRAYWWSNLFYFSNYVTENVFCIIQNWHTSVDMQLFILGLCLLVWTLNRGRSLVRWLLVLVMVGSSAMAAHIWWEDLDPFFLSTPQMIRTYKTREFIVHQFTHVNVPGFVIGMLTGHAVYHWQKEQVDFSKYKWWLHKLAELIFPLLVLVIYTGSYFYQDHGRHSLAVRMAYGAALRPIVAALTAYPIVSVVFGFKDYSFLEWHGWVLPSRLTYSVSLLHTLFIVLIFGTRHHLARVTLFNLFSQACAVLTMTVLLAVPYTLLIEAPFNRLLKQFLARDTSRQKKEESSKEDCIAEKEKMT